MSENQSSNINTQRRAILAATVGAAIASSTACAANKNHANHHAHHSDNKDNGITQAALDCVEKSERCLEHCTRLVAAGDTSIAECMRKVSETIAMCQALVKLSIYDSKHLEALAKTCIDVCRDCEIACSEHANKHAECKACATSCEECIDACKRRFHLI